MISRYPLYDIADLSSRFNLTEGLPKGVKPHYNNSPTVSAPVIVDREGTRVAKLMKWGLVAKGAKDTNSVFRYKTYNIPSEKIFSRHSWERAVRESRCLVPANGFYELNGSGKKRAFYVQSSDKSLIGLAGVYSSWQDPEGVTHGTYSIITTEATDDMPDSSARMPIIIKPEDEARWLDPAVTDANSLYDMLRPHSMGQLVVHEVSPAVHSPKPNQPSLIDPLS
jgi:putative SOS response-associated peptidase YedK